MSKICTMYLLEATPNYFVMSVTIGHNYMEYRYSLCYSTASHLCISIFYQILLFLENKPKIISHSLKIDTSVVLVSSVLPVMTGPITTLNGTF